MSDSNQPPAWGSDPGATPPPDQPTYPGPSYEQGPSYQQQPPPAYGQQPPYGQQPYGQPAYGQPYAYAPQPPKHQYAVLSMVLGIVSVAGVMFCIGPLAGPFAWYFGHRAVNEIDASGGTLGGRGEATAGRITGIIGTILLILVIAYFAFIFALIITES